MSAVEQLPTAQAAAAGQTHSSLRALKIFTAFQTSGRALNLSELALATRIPLSTCHGVVKALEQTGYLCALEGREFYPTRKLWQMAETIRANDPVTERLAPRLQKLCADSGETTILGVRQGDRVQYLLVCESQQAIRYSAAVGEFKPLYSSAIGKVMLSALSVDEFEQWLERQQLVQITPRTLTNPDELRADVHAGASHGVFITRGENVADVMAIAVPLRLESLVVGVALAGPLQRLERSETELIELLQTAALELEQAYVG